MKIIEILLIFFTAIVTAIIGIVSCKEANYFVRVIIIAVPILAAFVVAYNSYKDSKLIPIHEVINRNFELQKKLRRIAVVVEFNEEIDIDSLKPFVFALKLQCLGSENMPTFVCCNFFPCDVHQIVSINGKKALPTILETS